MTKVFLLDPTRNRWKTSFFYSGNCFDPIYLGYLGAYLKSCGHDVKIFQQREETEDEIESIIEGFSPDVLGISAMTYNVNAGRMFARKLKQKNPKIRTVFGGYHATALPSDLISNPEVDYIVVGEGEESLGELVSSLESGQESDIEQVKGLVHKRNGEIQFNGIKLYFTFSFMH
jgi:anaerobic magnesium-protoporphyrin IX monomethyl ester cyclase